MSTYSGMLIRDTFGDNGATPSSGNLWMSPDIIPNQNDALSWSGVSGTYNGPALAKPIITNETNWIFVRAKNIMPSAGTATVSLYESEASVFLYPAKWQQFSTPTLVNLVNPTASTPSAIPPGALAWGQQAFVLQNVPSSGHYCLIAVVNNGGQTFPIPSSFSQGNAGFVQWVSDSPNVAWRNLSVVNPSGTRAGTVVLFGNANSYESEFVFNITGTYLPSGGTVSFVAQCSDTRLPSGSYTASGSFNSQDAASFVIDLPANVGDNSDSSNPQMAMSITYSATYAMPSAQFQVDFYQVPAENGYPLEAEVARPYRIAGRHPETADGKEAATLIWLGAATTVVS
jgi:hypothetical protein